MPTLIRIVRKLRWSLAQRGLPGTVRFLLGRIGAKDDGKLRVHPFDLQHGVDTSGLIGGSDLVTGHAHDVYNTAYYGMSPSRFKGAIDLWMTLPPNAPIESYTLIDLGCGKGRAVLMATQLPFREVVGVELNRDLAQIAQENLQAWTAAGKSIAPARIVCSDATDFQLPAGPCLVYLFNPFAAPVVERLLGGLERAFQDRTDPLDLVYFNPEAVEVFEAHPTFRLLWSGTVPMSEEDAAADLVASPDDLCNLYRWTGS